MATDHERETAPQRVYRPPQVGADVHYVEPPRLGQRHAPHRAAKITETYHQLGGGTHPTRVDLVVWPPGGMYHVVGVELSPASHVPNTWHWPELVPPISG